MRAAVVVALLSATMVVGCLDGAPEHERTPFDGDEAYSHVQALVEQSRQGGGDDRAPEHEAHEERAIWLRDRLAATGAQWSVTLQTFTGADYMVLEKGAARGYAAPGSCPDEDLEALPGIRFHNVVADTGPAGAPRVLLAAHWDVKEEAHGTTEPIPGANDGTSGVGVLLEVARVLHGQWHLDDGEDLPFAVRIVFFDGEDGFEDCHPLAGSIYHAAELDRGEVDAMILLDMVGDGEGRFIVEGHSEASAPGLRALIWDAAETVGDGRFTDRRCSILDDHIPFVERQIASVDIIDYGRGGSCRFPPYWHTLDDDLGNISADALGSIGDVVLATLTEPAFASWLEDRDE